ncbi:MAG: sugar kinase [Bacillota bacterium]
MTKKIVTFGEIMLRLNPPGHQRIIQAQHLEASYAGGEANVAVSLAVFGMDAYYVTKLPLNSLGDAALGQLRRYGVKTDYIARGGDRLGVYFIEHGASQRASRVIYDRARSAIAEAKCVDFDWDMIFRGADWFHFTGITPALSEKAAFVTGEALKAARRNNVTVSCDLNFRKNLWSPEVANRVMSGLMPYVDVCVGNEEDAYNTFGLKPHGTDVNRGKIDSAGYRNVAERLMERFSLKLVATSLRESRSASDNGWSGILFDGQELYQSRKYDIHIVDRVGGGDSFAAGLIYTLLLEKDMQECVEFAAASSCLKQTLPGDFNLVTLDEVEDLKKGNASGRVQR